MAASVGALLGQKSFMAKLVGVKKSVRPAKDSKGSFEVLTTENDFVTNSSGLASIGLGKDREVILISKNDVEYILQKWNEFIGQIEKQGHTHYADPRKLLDIVSIFTRSSLKDSKKESEIENYIKLMANKYKKCGDVIAIDAAGIDKRAAIPLHQFMIHKAAVCRHYALINSVVMAYLVNRGYLPFGSVRQFRADTDNSAHAVATYISQGKIWVLENNNPSPFYLISINKLNPNDPTKPSDENRRALRFLKLVGPEFYKEMFTRLLPTQTVVPSADAKAEADQAAKAIAAKAAVPAAKAVAAAPAGNMAAGQGAANAAQPKMKAEPALVRQRPVLGAIYLPPSANPAAADHRRDAMNYPAQDAADLDVLDLDDIGPRMVAPAVQDMKGGIRWSFPVLDADAPAMGGFPESPAHRLAAWGHGDGFALGDERDMDGRLRWTLPLVDEAADDDHGARWVVDRKGGAEADILAELFPDNFASPFLDNKDGGGALPRDELANGNDAAAAAGVDDDVDWDKIKADHKAFMDKLFRDCGIRLDEFADGNDEAAAAGADDVDYGPTQVCANKIMRNRWRDKSPSPRPVLFSREPDNWRLKRGNAAEASAAAPAPRKQPAFGPYR